MVLLTELYEGQETAVLQLPAQPVTAAEIKARTSSAFDFATGKVFLWAAFTPEAASFEAWLFHPWKFRMRQWAYGVAKSVHARSRV
jgi:hypothetical protein